MRRAGWLALLFLLAACAGKDTVAPARSPGRVADPVTACPDGIVPGGDPLESGALEGKPIARVCVVGGSEASRTAIQRVALLRAGETLTAERVRADLEGLMKLALFDDASAFGLKVQHDAGVVVVYAVRDRPLVADIAFEGAKVLGDAALGAKLPIAKGSPYDPLRVNVIAQTIRDEYRARGYQGCRVVVVAESSAPAEVHVRIKVDEGPLWRLSKLDFRGNKKVAEADLRKAAGLSVGQPLVEDEVERATLLVSALFYDRGFVTMRLDREQASPDMAGNVAMTFVIDEGDVYAIRALHVTNLGAPLEKEILDKVVRARPKQVFVRASLVEDMARVKAFFAKRGQNVEIVPETAIDPQAHSVDLTLVVEAR